MPRYAVNDPNAPEGYANCQTCGQDYPARLIWLNPRYGWQCFRCWDGLIQRDQIMQPIFPFEGTRKTPAPVVQINAGIGPEDNYTVYTLHDLDSLSTTYDLFFGNFITWKSPSTSEFTPAEALDLNNGWFMFFKGGFLAWGRFPLPVPTTVTWGGSGDLSIDSAGFLEYTPYVQQALLP